MSTKADELQELGRATTVYAVHGLRWESRPVEVLARAAAQQAWAEHGRQAAGQPALPAWLALERLVAEAQLDGEPVGEGDRCSALIEALLAKRDAWDELARAARWAFLSTYRAELKRLAEAAR